MALGAAATPNTNDDLFLTGFAGNKEKAKIKEQLPGHNGTLQ
jgi:hypothetical protein